MVGDRVADVLIDKGGEFAHGFTYSGHPVACAVASVNLTLIQQEGLVRAHARRVGPVPRRASGASWPSTRWSARPARSA